MDKTLKLRAFAEEAQKKHASDEQAKAAAEASALEKKTAQLEEEQRKSLELFKTIIQMREDLKKEQERAASLEAKLHKLDSVEENQLVRKNAELEDARKKLNEAQKLNEHLRASLEQEGANSAEMAKKLAALESNAGDSASTAEKELVAAIKQLEAEKKYSAELKATVEGLRENIKQDLSGKAAEMEKVRAMEARVAELTAVVEKIVGIAASSAGKL